MDVESVPATVVVHVVPLDTMEVVIVVTVDVAVCVAGVTVLVAIEVDL